MDLPYVDEHRQRIDASPAAVWTSLLKMLGGMSNAPIARVLGCEPATGTGPLIGAVGETVPGFRIVEVEPNKRLALRGRHRFSDYALTFTIDGGVLRAETHAAFPGLAGRMYRAAVIGSGAHKLATRRMLRQVARAT